MSRRHRLAGGCPLAARRRSAVRYGGWDVSSIGGEGAQGSTRAEGVTCMFGRLFRLPTNDPAVKKPYVAQKSHLPRALQFRATRDGRLGGPCWTRYRHSRTSMCPRRCARSHGGMLARCKDRCTGRTRRSISRSSSVSGKPSSALVGSVAVSSRSLFGEGVLETGNASRFFGARARFATRLQQHRPRWRCLRSWKRLQAYVENLECAGSIDATNVLVDGRCLTQGAGRRKARHGRRARGAVRGGRLGGRGRSTQPGA